MDKLTIALDSWVLLDGSYECVDFSVGQHVKFALQYYTRHYSVSNNPLSLAPLAGRPYVYKACGQVVFRSDFCHVLNIGSLSAFGTGPVDLKLGQVVEGELTIRIDTSEYYERLNKLPGIPPLIYEWRIEGIDMDTSPLEIIVNDHGQKVRTINDAIMARQAIRNINTSLDKLAGCNGTYLLHCSKLDTPPSLALD